MPKIGCVIRADEYALADQIGYDYIELSGRNTCAMDDRDFQKLVRTVKNGRIPCLGFNAYCPREVVIAGPGYSDAVAGDYAKACRERAVELGVNIVGVGSPFSRTLPGDYNQELAWEQAVSFFRITSEVFAEAGITVCIEALSSCYTNFINTVKEATRLISLVDRENLKLVVDFYNMEMMGEAEMDLAPLIPQIAHAHISDDDGAPTRRWFLKEEKIPLHQQRVSSLLSAGYQGGISLEVDLPLQANIAKQSLEALKSVHQKNH